MWAFCPLCLKSRLGLDETPPFLAATERLHNIMRTHHGGAKGKSAYPSG